jgi:hypothetical protein
VEAILTDGATTSHAENRRFYVWTAAVFVLIAFGGFIPTYWARVLTGTFQGPPILHVHGILLFSWTLFYFLQTALVASGRIASHRTWGLFGIALFSVLACSIVIAQSTVMRLEDAHGMGRAGRAFGAVTSMGLVLMIGLFAAAIANIRKPENHKRLMYTLMATMMTPAVARVMLAFLAPPGAASSGPPPVFVAIPPALVGFLMIAVALVYDWRTRGRPHQAYVYGGAVFLLENLLLIPISNSQAWMSTAEFLEHLTG